jgi:hypothetical protein
MWSFLKVPSAQFIFKLVPANFTARFSHRLTAVADNSSPAVTFANPY